MGLDAMIERLEKRGFKVEVVGDDRSAKLVVDGVIVGYVVDDTVHLS